MSLFIHHESVMPAHGGDEDGFDIVETSDGFTIWHQSMSYGDFTTLAYAMREAERLAAIFDQEHTGAICPADGNGIADDGVCGFCGNTPEAYLNDPTWPD